MFRSKGRSYFTPEEVDLLLREKDGHIADLGTLLQEERERTEALLDRCLGPQPNHAYPEPTVAAPPDWNWQQIQPEDEAIADVKSMQASGEIGKEEAEAILASLGFSETEVTYS